MPIVLHSQYICFHTQSLLTDGRAFKEQLAYDIQRLFFLQNMDQVGLAQELMSLPMTSNNHHLEELTDRRKKNSCFKETIAKSAN